MTAAPSFGRSQVCTRPAELASMRTLGCFGVAGRISDAHSCSAIPAGHRVVRRRLPIERQVQDLADGLARTLRGREPLALAGAQEQRLAVRREGDDRAELSALPAGRVVPQQLEA